MLPSWRRAQKSLSLGVRAWLAQNGYAVAEYPRIWLSLGSCLEREVLSDVVADGLEEEAEPDTTSPDLLAASGFPPLQLYCLI